MKKYLINLVVLGIFSYFFLSVNVTPAYAEDCSGIKDRAWDAFVCDLKNKYAAEVEAVKKKADDLTCSFTNTCTSCDNPRDDPNCSNYRAPAPVVAPAQPLINCETDPGLFGCPKPAPARQCSKGETKVCSNLGTCSDGRVCATGHQYCLDDGSGYGGCAKENDSCNQPGCQTGGTTPAGGTPPAVKPVRGQAAPVTTGTLKTCEYSENPRNCPNGGTRICTGTDEGKGCHYNSNVNPACTESCTPVGGGTSVTPDGKGGGGCCTPDSTGRGSCRAWEKCDIANDSCSSGSSSGFSCRSATPTTNCPAGVAAGSACCARDTDCGGQQFNKYCKGGVCAAGSSPAGNCQSAISLQARFSIKGSLTNSGTAIIGEKTSAAVYRNGTGEFAGAVVNNDYTPADVSANITGPNGFTKSVNVASSTDFTFTTPGTYTLKAACGSVTGQATLIVTGTATQAVSYLLSDTGPIPESKTVGVTGFFPLTTSLHFTDINPGTKTVFVRFFYADGTHIDSQKSIIYRPVVKPSPTPTPTPTPPTPTASPYAGNNGPGGTRGGQCDSAGGTCLDSNQDYKSDSYCSAPKFWRYQTGVTGCASQYYCYKCLSPETTAPPSSTPPPMDCPANHCADSKGNGPNGLTCTRWLQGKEGDFKNCKDTGVYAYCYSSCNQ